MKKNLILVLLLFFAVNIYAQQDSLKSHKESKLAAFKDTLDGKLDFSHFLIDMHGFMPVPMIITEPALGGFGGVMVAAFITPKKTENAKGYTPPDITALMAGYTLNDTWMLGAFRMGSVPKWGIKYRAFAGYSSIDMNFYRTLPLVGEKEFSFNIESTPLFGSVSRKLFSQLYLGLTYAYMPTKVAPNFKGEVPGFIEDVELDNKTAAAGTFLEWDTRNSIFTPDKGIRINTEYKINANWTGSDFDYQRFNGSFNGFIPLQKTWISGFRVEYQEVFNDPPFYFLPGISLRGVPAARYQGNQTIVTETEQRVDVSFRWSVVGFVGWGKAIGKNETFADATNVYNVGTGFRYLMARAFNLRAGIDVAMGPDDSFAYYITFGHNWNR